MMKIIESHEVTPEDNSEGEADTTEDESEVREVCELEDEVICKENSETESGSDSDSNIGSEDSISEAMYYITLAVPRKMMLILSV